MIFLTSFQVPTNQKVDDNKMLPIVLEVPQTFLTHIRSYIKYKLIIFYSNNTLLKKNHHISEGIFHGV